ncbi:RNA polymerase sigma factor region1.1 domain-containing protein, partial [Senegalia sp. (in: firmicutes)]
MNDKKNDKKTKKANKNDIKKEALIKKIINKGKKKGMLTYKEIIDPLEEMDLSPGEIDEIYQEIEDKGIDVVGDKEDD